MRRLITLFAIFLLAGADSVRAQQSQEFGDYIVHFNALNTSLLTPQVAQSYGIQRSSSRAMLNIAVLKRGDAGVGSPVNATVEANATNLTGQRRDIQVREITDTQGAVYYIGEMRVRNMETFDFILAVTPEGEQDALEVTFRQQFFTE